MKKVPEMSKEDKKILKKARNSMKKFRGMSSLEFLGRVPELCEKTIQYFDDGVLYRCKRKKGHSGTCYFPKIKGRPSWDKRHPLAKRIRNIKSYQKNREHTIERNKKNIYKRLKENSEYRFRQEVEASHRGYRKETLANFHNRCSNCYSIAELQLHHLKYIKGREGLKYVIVLCKKCHKDRHFPLPEVSM